jgi:acetylornithine deacetylase/succinyl-diaminopimelate desuccinylase-like protein
MSAATSIRESTFDEVAWAREFVSRIVADCPSRTSTGEDERRAHALVADELEALGLETQIKPFEWNKSVYANLALHFGLGTLGSVVAERTPGLGLALHALTAASYAADSSRKAFLLRRLFPFRRSQNVLGTIRAKREPRLRVVFLAHVDAAYTGIIFRPEIASRAAKPGSFMHKSLRIATGALAGLAAVDALQMYFGKSRALRLLRLGLSVPPLIAFLVNLDVVLRNHTVPGAMDDLSGVAGILLLARRLRERAPEDVEIVFVGTGCEESGLGGAQSLCEQMKNTWSRDRTVVIGLDGLANGELRFFQEGEIFPVPLAPWLRQTIVDVAASDPRFAEVTGFEIPVGGTDAVPFASTAYPAVTLGCVDPGRGMPREYHLPSDTPENLEVEKIPFCIDFAERLFDAIVARHNV